MNPNPQQPHQLVRRSVLTPGTLHLREGSESGRTIEGYAILFDSLSEVMWGEDDYEVREVIDPSAITRELLDQSNIAFTLFHDDRLLLARSNKGEGTLSYDIDERGVRFSFEAPRTVDGDKALELVRRGDAAGCSFAFTTHYWDEDFVARERTVKDGRTTIVYRVKIITGIYDMTLTGRPAYPETSAEARELRSLSEAISRRETARETGDEVPAQSAQSAQSEDSAPACREEVAEMRRAAALPLTL